MTTKDFEAIRRLIAIYGQLIDSKRLKEWGDLFTEDGVFRVWGQTYSGREEIVREIGGMQPDVPGKHVVLQPVIDFLASDRARCWTDLLGIGSSESGISIVTLGRYHDDLLRSASDGHWRIYRRVLVMGGEDVPEDVEPSPSR
jgi:hypothetical protein